MGPLPGLRGLRLPGLPGLLGLPGLSMRSLSASCLIFSAFRMASKIWRFAGLPPLQSLDKPLSFSRSVPGAIFDWFGTFVAAIPGAGCRLGVLCRNCTPGKFGIFGMPTSSSAWTCATLLWPLGTFRCSSDGLAFTWTQVHRSTRVKDTFLPASNCETCENFKVKRSSPLLISTSLFTSVECTPSEGFHRLRSGPSPPKLGPMLSSTGMRFVGHRRHRMHSRSWRRQRRNQV